MKSIFKSNGAAMKFSCKKIMCVSLVIGLCFALSGCGETEEKSELDLIIADLSTSYLDDGATPEETTSLSEETDASEENTTEELTLSSVTGRISSLNETEITVEINEEEKITLVYDSKTSVYGAESLETEQKVTVTYNNSYAVAVVII